MDGLYVIRQTKDGYETVLLKGGEPELCTAHSNIKEALDTIKFYFLGINDK